MDKIEHANAVGAAYEKGLHEAQGIADATILKCHCQQCQDAYHTGKVNGYKVANNEAKANQPRKS